MEEGLAPKALEDRLAVLRAWCERKFRGGPSAQGAGGSARRPQSCEMGGFELGVRGNLEEGLAPKALEDWRRFAVLRAVKRGGFEPGVRGSLADGLAPKALEDWRRSAVLRARSYRDINK